ERYIGAGDPRFEDRAPCFSMTERYSERIGMTGGTEHRDEGIARDQDADVVPIEEQRLRKRAHDVAQPAGFRDRCTFGCREEHFQRARHPDLILPAPPTVAKNRFAYTPREWPAASNKRPPARLSRARSAG